MAVVLNLNQDDLLNMHDQLEDEMLQLRKERGKQERLATSITDQMQVEAQVSLALSLFPFCILFSYSGSYHLI